MVLRSSGSQVVILRIAVHGLLTAAREGQPALRRVLHKDWMVKAWGNVRNVAGNSENA